MDPAISVGALWPLMSITPAALDHLYGGIVSSPRWTDITDHGVLWRSWSIYLAAIRREI